MKQNKEMISIAEFARRVNISRAQAYVWLKKGLIPLRRIRVGQKNLLLWNENKIAQKLTPIADDKIRLDLIKARVLIDRILAKLIDPDIKLAKRLIAKSSGRKKK